MKSLKQLTSNKILTVVIFLITVNLANGEIALFKISEELLNSGYSIKSCARTSQNQLSLFMVYINNSEPYRVFRAYALIDTNGQFIQEPDSVCIFELEFLPSQAFFDDRGRFFIYSNNGEFYCDNLFRLSYDPEIHSSRFKQFKDINIGAAKCGQSVANLGNVVLLGGRSPKEPLMTMLIDDWKNNNTRLIDMKIEDRRNRIFFLEAIQELPDNRLLITGCTSGGSGTNEEYPLRIIKYIFDYQKEKILSMETIPVLEVLNSCSGQYVLPFIDRETIFSANGHYFYRIPVESEHINPERVLKDIFVELDSDGNFVLGDKTTHLTFQESTLETTPEKYIPLLKYDEDTHANKLWIMSLDNFPNIVIDKGE